MIDLEKTRLQLMQLLKVLSATDTDNEKALQEMPGSLTIAAELAERIFCTIVDSEVK